MYNSAYGNLTVRGLLDTINQCLKEFDFPDPYLIVRCLILNLLEKLLYKKIQLLNKFQQKRTENEYALTCLQKRLEELDSLDVEKRQEELIMGVLAGNTFDWGAKETVALMKTGTFDFKQARSKIPGKYLQLINIKLYGLSNTFIIIIIIIKQLDLG